MRCAASVRLQHFRDIPTSSSSLFRRVSSGQSADQLADPLEVWACCLPTASLKLIENPAKRKELTRIAFRKRILSCHRLINRSSESSPDLVLYIAEIGLVRRIEATDRFKFCKIVPVDEVGQIGFVAEPGTGYGKRVVYFDTVPDTSAVVL